MHYFDFPFVTDIFKGFEHISNSFMLFHKYMSSEVKNIQILIGLFKQSEI